MIKYLIVLFVFTTNILLAQNNDEIQTLLGNELKYGGYGSFDMRFSNFDAKAGLLLGGRGGVILNHKLVIGGGGYGLANRTRVTLTDLNGNDSMGRMNFGYGGILLEYIFFPQKPFHFAVPLLIGSGSTKIYNISDDFFSNSLIESSTFLLLEPGIDIELNLLKFVRFTCGASYRLASGTFLQNLNDNDLSGLSINASFKFGYF